MPVSVGDHVETSITTVRNGVAVVGVLPTEVSVVGLGWVPLEAPVPVVLKRTRVPAQRRLVPLYDYHIEGVAFGGRRDSGIRGLVRGGGALRRSVLVIRPISALDVQIPPEQRDAV